jgi:hypothetical protein
MLRWTERDLLWPRSTNASWEDWLRIRFWECFDDTAAAEAPVASSAVVASPASSAAPASSATHGGPAFDPAGAKNVGNGKGVQFIGGQVSTPSCVPLEEICY